MITPELKKHLKIFAQESDSWFSKNSWLDDNFRFFKDFFSEKKLETAEWSDFQGMGDRIHAFNSLAIAKKNALGKPNLSIQKYRSVFKFLKNSNDPIDIIIDNLRNKNGKYHLPQFGESAISELIAYARPREYVIYNRRSIEALKTLNIDFQNKRGESFGKKFKRYNSVLSPIKELYENVVGKKTKTSVEIELDQFFSWVYETNHKKGKGFPELIQSLALQLKNDSSILKDFLFDNPRKNYVWISDCKKIIGKKKAHYEIIKRKENIFIELHLEGNEAEKSLIRNNLKSIPEGIEWFKWNKSESLRLSRAFKDSSDNIINELRNGLLTMEQGIGDKVRELLTTNNPPHPKDTPVNQILFGPPGTGKTYNVVPYALNIVNGFELKNTYSQDEWESLKKQFDDLRKNGRIEFVTFHQSMNYEDFVEGIKPKMDETSTEKAEKPEQLEYEIVDGVFKKIADRAAVNEKISRQRENYMMPSDVLSKIDKVDFGKFRFENWMPGNEVYEYCMSNNCICIPYEIDYDFSDSNDEKQTEKILVDKDLGWHEKVGIKTINYWLKKNDIVFVTSVGKNIVKAVAQITSDYYYNSDSPISYSHFRKVKWLMRDVSIPVESIYTTQFSSYAASLLYRHNVRKEFFKNQDKRENLKYVLIIDEINRGNIAAIFGELITLLEPSKRIGGPEHFKIKLPYSKSDFEVPSNLYIVGTMNTADRSVEALDTALRRRFCFVEMPPIYDLPVLDYEIDGVTACDLLRTINIRIEKLLDKDHLIGHSYFIKNQEEEPESKLLNAFYKNIIPLLQEYFYGDYGKIGLVLGEGFVSLTEWNDSGDVFASFATESGADYEDKQVYRIIDYRIKDHGYMLKVKEKPEVKMTFTKAIKLLMKQTIE